jgi:hypothetical protein
VKKGHKKNYFLANAISEKNAEAKYYETAGAPNGKIKFVYF